MRDMFDGFGGVPLAFCGALMGVLLGLPFVLYFLMWEPVFLCLLAFGEEMACTAALADVPDSYFVAGLVLPSFMVISGVFIASGSYALKKFFNEGDLLLPCVIAGYVTLAIGEMSVYGFNISTLVFWFFASLILVWLTVTMEGEQAEGVFYFGASDYEGRWNGYDDGGSVFYFPDEGGWNGDDDGGGVFYSGACDDEGVVGASSDRYRCNAGHEGVAVDDENPTNQ